MKKIEFGKVDLLRRFLANYAGPEHFAKFNVDYNDATMTVKSIDPHIMDVLITAYRVKVVDLKDDTPDIFNDIIAPGVVLASNILTGFSKYTIIKYPESGIPFDTQEEYDDYRKKFNTDPEIEIDGEDPDEYPCIGFPVCRYYESGKKDKQIFAFVYPIKKD